MLGLNINTKKLIKLIKNKMYNQNRNKMYRFIKKSFNHYKNNKYKNNNNQA
jgi:hypothetical protein